jgi:acyl-CoA synthetase (AMP-forming)/AMP-acid ligase II
MNDFLAASAGVIDAATGRQLSGKALRRALASASRAYDRLPSGVLFALTGHTMGSVVRYLAAPTVGRQIAVLDPDLPTDALAGLVARFKPAAVIGLDARVAAAVEPAPPEYATDHLDGLGGVWRRTGPPGPAPHPELAVLLATSGSTGAPKFVRLSQRAVSANALAIAEALEIDANEVAPTTLPLFYSYGLSVLNSHMAAGATVVLTASNVLSREFWRACKRHRATSMAGVPRQYEMLARIRWNAPRFGISTLTQAGGRLSADLVRHFHAQLETDGRFYVMYGQTEATARISVLPPERLADKPGSVGLAVSGGSLRIRGDSTAPDGSTVSGEVVYHGPNVMFGYAEEAEDLTRGDELHGILATGDVGHLDQDGFLYITGRMGRQAKVFGVRVDLDHVELVAGAALDPGCAVAAVAVEDRVVVWCEEGVAVPGDIADRLADTLRAHRSGFEIRGIDHIPTLPGGKVDYPRLTAGAMGESPSG